MFWEIVKLAIVLSPFAPAAPAQPEPQKRQLGNALITIESAASAAATNKILSDLK
jgi:hypothetical protein